MHFGLTVATVLPWIRVLGATETISMVGLDGTLASTAQADACAGADTSVNYLTPDAA